jgi:hypothetical protein
MISFQRFFKTDMTQKINILMFLKTVVGLITLNNNSGRVCHGRSPVTLNHQVILAGQLTVCCFFLSVSQRLTARVCLGQRGLWSSETGLVPWPPSPRGSGEAARGSVLLCLCGPGLNVLPTSPLDTQAQRLHD